MTSGVYAIVCKTNRRAFVGSSKNIEQYWENQRRTLAKGAHHCRPLQADWDTLGESAFKLKILTEVPEDQLTVSVAAWAKKLKKHGVLYNDGSHTQFGRAPKTKRWKRNVTSLQFRQNVSDGVKRAWARRKAQQDGTSPPPPPP